MRFLVTGGSGFIGSALCRYLVSEVGAYVLNVDCLTYSGTNESLKPIQNHPNFAFSQTNICDIPKIGELLRTYKIDTVVNLAAESHVDRSIDGPEAFIETNVVGTFRLLSATLNYWRELEGSKRDHFRFHHVSTDEVFGDLPFDRGIFTEETPYAPSSPYSASKAASDHLVRAWHDTYGLPVVLTNCSNNYGPYQFPEKLIPLVILNALHGKPLPIYGKGENVRDWLFVEDHVRALHTVATNGAIGQSYNVGGNSERTNLQVVQSICRVLDRIHPRANGHSYGDLITFVSDRPGHDRRYAIDSTKIARELGWKPSVDFDTGLSMTVDWYLESEWWWRPLRNGRYSGARLGMDLTATQNSGQTK